MAEDFDPYYKWLGIPPKDQPPNYYRLLGIELFEPDQEVITIAAEQRILHVRAFQTGEYVIVSQKLQKKIAAAKACLLNPEKKAEYDISLRLQLRLHSAQTSSTPAKPPPLPPKALSLPAQSPTVPLPLRDYAGPPPMAQPAPEQPSGTEFSINPVVVFNESMDYLRTHKWIVSVTLKLICVAVVVVIMLVVFVHGKTLWNFTFDKTSVLVAKMTGSSEEKPPERRTLIRGAPRVKPGGTDDTPSRQVRATSPPAAAAETPVAGETTGAVNPVPPPPAPENNQALTPTPSPDSGITAGSATGIPPDTASPNNIQGQPPDKSSTAAAEITSLKLPSGKIFKSRLFKINLVSIVDLVKDPAKDEQVIFFFHPGGHISALASHDKGVLNGICMAFYDNFHPMTYASYADGALDGMIKTWNTKGERAYWCQYEKGVRQGFCCYFKDNYLRLLLELDHDAISGVHLCANGELEKSFSSIEEASTDKNAQKLLDEVDELESELKINEAAFKKQIKAEFQSLRREKTGLLTPQKRAAIQDRINLRVIESQELIKNLRNCDRL